MSQLTLEQVVQNAVCHHEAGRLAEAESLYRQILSLEPNNHQALHMLGLLLGQSGRLDQAIESIYRATIVYPQAATYHSNLAKYLCDRGQFVEAITSSKRAIALQPDCAEAFYNLGIALSGKGDFVAAISAFGEALRLKPDFIDAYSNLGVAQHGCGDYEGAIASFRCAVRLRPSADAYYSLGTLLFAKNQIKESILAFREALALQPQFPEAYNNLGAALQAAGRLDDAIAAYHEALRLNPNYADASNNLGMMLKDAGRLDEAIACYRRALELKTDYAGAHSNLIYTMLFASEYDAHQIAEEQSRWNVQHAKPLNFRMMPHANDRDPNRPLRIGYISPDFCDHVVGRNLLPLFREHDRHQFAAIGYSNVAIPDRLTQQFCSQAQQWRNIAGLTDEQVASCVRSDKIDILFDLSLHLAGNRLRVFAMKPAPVQVTFAGYPGSTGLTAIDYRLSDPYLDPPDAPSEGYSEETVRLAHSFWCYDPLGSDLAVSALPALSAGRITFGCLNNFCKVNEVMLRSWAAVMSAVPNSRLLLLAAEGNHRAHTVDVLRKAGIASDRIEFSALQPRPRYLELYHGIDISLDTLPYNGHTTSLDSLWMGVPVVTLAGTTVVGRAGVSQLMNLGMPELIARTPEQFVQIASGLAGDLPRLAALRAGLRGRMEASPLMDARQFAVSIEAACRGMWQRWCARI